MDTSNSVSDATAGSLDAPRPPSPETQEDVEKPSASELQELQEMRQVLEVKRRPTPIPFSQVYVGERDRGLLSPKSDSRNSLARSSISSYRFRAVSRSGAGSASPQPAKNQLIILLLSPDRTLSRAERKALYKLNVVDYSHELFQRSSIHQLKDRGHVLLLHLGEDRQKLWYETQLGAIHQQPDAYFVVMLLGRGETQDKDKVAAYGPANVLKRLPDDEQLDIDEILSRIKTSRHLPKLETRARKVFKALLGLFL